MVSSPLPAVPISPSRGLLVVCLVAVGLGLAGAVVVAEPLDEHVQGDPATEFTISSEGVNATNGDEVVVIEAQAFERVELERTTATSFDVDVEEPDEPTLSPNDRERAVIVASQSELVRETLDQEPDAYSVTVEQTQSPAEISVEVGKDLNVSDEPSTFDVSFDETSATVTRTSESLYAAVTFNDSDSTTATVDLEDERVRSVSQPLQPDVEKISPE